MAALIGADPEEIIFTSCGTESDNTAILSALSINPDRRHIVTSAVGRPAIRALCEHLLHEGYRVTSLDVDRDGNVDMDQYERSLSPDTAIVRVFTSCRWRTSGKQSSHRHREHRKHYRSGKSLRICTVPL